MNNQEVKTETKALKYTMLQEILCDLDRQVIDTQEKLRDMADYISRIRAKYHFSPKQDQYLLDIMLQNLRK